MIKSVRIISLSVIFISLPLQAAETVRHKYDALGRLVKMTKSGGPAGGTQTNTNHDPAGNRTCQSTTGVGGSAGTACPPLL